MNSPSCRQNFPAVIIIDAGDGGKDTEQRSDNLIDEKDIYLSIAKMLQSSAKSNPKINVILTRENDEFLELSKRVNKDADLSYITDNQNQALISDKIIKAISKLK